MLLKLAALGAVGYAGYKYYEKNKAEDGGFAGSRADATRDRNWTKTDEELDESFPASDPPANY